MERVLFYCDDNVNFPVVLLTDEIYGNNLLPFGLAEVRGLADTRATKSISSVNYVSGVNAYMRMTYSNILDFNENIQIDMNIAVFNLANRTLIKKDESFKIEINSSGNILWSIYHNASWHTLTSKYVFNLYEFFKVSVKYDGYNLFLYIDGILDSILNYEGNINNNSNDLYLYAGDNLENIFQGEIDQIRIKTNVDDNILMYSANKENTYSDIVSRNTSTSLNIKGFKNSLTILDNFNYIIEGMKEFIEISRSGIAPLKIIGYKNYIFENFKNVNSVIDPTNTTAIYDPKNHYYTYNPSSYIIQTLNLIPYAYPITYGIAPDYEIARESWDINRILYAENTDNFSSSQLTTSYYSIDGGNNWNLITNGNYTQVFNNNVTDFRIKIILNNSISIFKGFGINFIS